MEERSGKAREAGEHKCEEYMKYDGGRKENRDGLRV